MTISFTKFFKKSSSTKDGSTVTPAAVKAAVNKPSTTKPKHNGEDVCCGSCSNK